MAVISFSIKTSQEKRLEAFLKEGESLNLCAKRLLLGLLKEDEPESLDDLDDLDDSQASTIRDRLETLESAIKQSLASLEERVSKIEGENIGDNIGDSEDRLTALEQKLDTVLADRDNLLVCIANQQNQHIEDIKQIYKDANDLNTKLEKENYELQKYNNDAQRENDFLEARLKGVPITDPQYVQLLETRIGALEAGYLAFHQVEGFSSAQLAQLLKCDRTTLSRWKQKGDPRLDDWEFKDNKWYRKSNC
jgi:seryl-tRNA synthetase